MKLTIVSLEAEGTNQEIRDMLAGVDAVLEFMPIGERFSVEEIAETATEGIDLTTNES